MNVNDRFNINIMFTSKESKRSDISNTNFVSFVTFMQ